MEAAARRAHVSISQPEWQDWANLPWMNRSAAAGSEIRLWLRLVESAAKAESRAAFFRQELPEIASEFGSQWVGILQRGHDWERIAEFGRQPFEALPLALLSEALDRDAAGLAAIEGGGDGGGWNFACAPLHHGGEPADLLVLCGRGLNRKLLPGAFAAARALGWASDVTGRLDQAGRRIDRLRTTLEIASQLGSVRETKPLLELIASQAARLLDADRASIFTWDRQHHEVVACPALGFEGNLLRIPDSTGIVGECLQTGRAIRVEDAYGDPRFNRQIDAKSGYKTRNLICVPLLDQKGERIGAFEAINKKQGTFTAEDEESLIELGVQAAVALAGTREREGLVRRHKQLTDQVSQEVEIIGRSPAIEALRGTIDRLAATDLPVLVLGGSGTGKEVIAQALHYRGPRRDHPFVAVNCAAVTETLLESELFGHEKGAFTDAHETRAGKFELAEGGTLFLDEIGDMSGPGQAKLLRVLEQKVITRVGGSQPIRINVRIIAATNVNLAEAVRQKKFREDLYYRLSVVALDLPALRDRPQDIFPLAEHFLAQFCAKARRPKLEISPEARLRLESHPWPGNVRELRNLMERIAFLTPNERVESSDLAFILSPDADAAVAATDLRLGDATDRFQAEYIRRMLRRFDGNMSAAARTLGMHRSNLYRKMWQLGMIEVQGQEPPAPESLEPEPKGEEEQSG